MATHRTAIRDDGQSRAFTGLATVDPRGQDRAGGEGAIASGRLPARAIRRRENRSPLGPRRAPEERGVLPPALAALLAAGDRESKAAAWAPFVEAYTPLLLHTAYRFGHTYDGAMDRYAYFLEHLYRNDFHRLRGFAAAGPGRFTTWLVVVARRLCLDYHRQRYGRARPPAAEAGNGIKASSGIRRQLAEMAGDEEPLSTIEDCSRPDPEAMTYAAEWQAALHAAVSSLEARDRLLLVLRFDKELPAHEIAEVMGFATQFHVYRRLRTVLAMLGRRIPREYVQAVP